MTFNEAALNAGLLALGVTLLAQVLPTVGVALYHRHLQTGTGVHCARRGGSACGPTCCSSSPLGYGLYLLVSRAALPWVGSCAAAIRSSRTRCSFSSPRWGSLPWPW
ncbi:MAG: hypothetical protein R2856_02765 [Caldilineaceae bacterium]